ncbi:MAG: DUF3500 domain-containing protein [Gemmataceae bacterium]
MKLNRLLVAFVAVGIVCGLAYVAQERRTTADRMTAAAKKFMASLEADQQKKATYPFDSEERTNWNFVPLQKSIEGKRVHLRKGLPLHEMTEKQQRLAINLLASGTSLDGKNKAVLIMALEGILNKLQKNGGTVRNPEWYNVTIFGEPSKTGKWGWRIEGHHLSLNYTLEGGKIISTTPAFFGANPAVVYTKRGSLLGYEALPSCEILAQALFRSLDKGQQKVVLQKKAFGEPKQGSPTADVGEPVGLPASKMNEKQKKLLTKLIRTYAMRMPFDLGRKEWERVEEAGFEKVHFAYTGGVKRGVPHTYRVQGPTFVIEFLNTQPGGGGKSANHIHSCWRAIGGDFGLQAK